MNDLARTVIAACFRPLVGCTADALTCADSVARELSRYGFDIVASKPGPAGRTVPVRIAVAVNSKGHSAVLKVIGSDTDYALLYARASARDAVASAIITADIPIPETPVIAAEVEA